MGWLETGLEWFLIAGMLAVVIMFIIWLGMNIKAMLSVVWVMWAPVGVTLYIQYNFKLSNEVAVGIWFASFIASAMLLLKIREKILTRKI